MKRFGLIGYPLGHSFSKSYFTEKFHELGLDDHVYELFEIEKIELFLDLWNDQELIGLNVTVPYKEQVIPYLSELDRSAQQVGAVNVIKREQNMLRGYNSDYFGFYQSLKKSMGPKKINNALILGTGGASKAVKAVLTDMGISVNFVSRNAHEGILDYQGLKQSGISEYEVIVNTTPLGMFPRTETFPDIPYEQIGPDHLLFDLVYNPEMTQFMKKGQDQKARIANGLDMLHLQADKAWEIWNS